MKAWFKETHAHAIMQEVVLSPRAAKKVTTSKPLGPVDDAIGAASVHGIAGFWGTIVIGLWGIDGDTGIGVFNGGDFTQLGAQLMGAFAYAIWAVVLSFVVFGVLKATIGLRVSEEEELEGLDVSEHGSLAYPGKRTRE